MKFYAATLAALAVTMVGCANPATQAPVPQLGAASAPADAPAAVAAPGSLAERPAHGYRMGILAAEDRVVVRFKQDRRIERLSFGHISRSLGIDRTHVYKVKNTEERDAMIAELKKNPDVEIAEPDYIMQATALSNDPQVGQQWGLSKIDMAGAWSVTRGSANVTVAVVDTGVDYNHPDLAGRIVKGYDFANNDNDPMDDQGHGTHCAGVIAANTDNGVGVAGMTSNTKVLAVKVLGGDGSGTTSSIADGINYATQQGVKVMSLSLGGPQESSVLKAAIDKAVAAGVVVVAAAGNDGRTGKNYPAGYDNVIAVGATNSSDARTSFSTYGSWVDIAAPGDKILSTVRSGKYESMSGTSMAGPHVAAGAALVLAKNPTYTASQVRQALVSTGDPATGFELNPSLRRLNMAKALGATAGASPAPAPSASPTPAPSTAPTPAPSTAPTTQPSASPTPAPSTSFSFSNIAAVNVTSRSATIRWNTSQPALGVVEYGYSTRFGRYSSQTAMGTSHSVNLSNLYPGQTYYYRVLAKDAAGVVRGSYVTAFRTRYY